MAHDEQREEGVVGAQLWLCAGAVACAPLVFGLIALGAWSEAAHRVLRACASAYVVVAPCLAALTAAWLLWTAWSPVHAGTWRRLFVAWLSMAVALVAVSTLLSTLARHPHFHDVGDNFHYYLGTRYFPELGYTRLYECTGVALQEMGRDVPRRIRDLASDRHVRLHVDDAMRARCHAAFTPTRWKKFMRNVRFYRNRHTFDEFEHRLTDHGYNGTPFWTAVSGAISNRVAVTDTKQTWLGLANVALLAVMGCVLLQCCGLELGLCLLLLTLVTYPDRLILIGAHLRYLWIALLYSGLALLGKGRAATAAVLISLAAGLLIFPVLFLAGSALALALSLLRGKRPAPEQVRFALAAGLTLGVVFVVSLGEGRGLQAWEDFLHQMDINSVRLATGRIGFVYNFVWPKALATDATDYAAAARALAEPRLWGLSLDHLHWALAALLVLAVARWTRAVPEPGFSALLGFTLFFVGFGAVRYYYAGLVCLPLYAAARFGMPRGRAVLGVMLGLQALSFSLHPFVSHSFLHNSVLSSGLTLMILWLVALERSPGGQRLPSPSPSPIRRGAM